VLLWMLLPRRHVCARVPIILALREGPAIESRAPTRGWGHHLLLLLLIRVLLGLPLLLHGGRWRRRRLMHTVF
jgi:hypothetical protein